MVFQGSKDRIKKYSRKYIGSTYTTNEGYLLEVIDGGSKGGYCTIKINEWVSEASVSNIIKGTVRYPNHKSIFGVGFIGLGPYSWKTHKEIYIKWHSMLRRCYSTLYHSRQPTYVGTIVCQKWHSLQSFGNWYSRFHPTDGRVYALDKDLLGKDVYSPTTCVFLPQELNSYMTNIKDSNSSGYVGVSWVNSLNKWRVRLNINGRNKLLGNYLNAQEASKVYKEARRAETQRVKNYYSFDYPKYVLDNIK